MRILNFTAHQEERDVIYTEDFYNNCINIPDDTELVFSIRCCGYLVVEEVVELFDPSDNELEEWAADKLSALLNVNSKRNN